MIFLGKHGVRPLNKFEEILRGVKLTTKFPEFDPISSLGEYNTHYIGPVFMEDSIAPNQDYPKLTAINVINILLYGTI